MDCIYCKRRNEEGVLNCVKCGKELLPIININDLNYKVVDMSLADTLSEVKVGFFYKGDLKKITKLISEGKCEVTPVLIQGDYYINTSDYDQFTESYDRYYKLLTTSNNPISHDIEIVNFQNYEPLEGEETFIFRVKIGKKYKYMLLPNCNSNYIIEHMKGFLNVLSNNTRKRETTDIVDVAFQKIGDFFNKEK